MEMSLWPDEDQTRPVASAFLDPAAKHKVMTSPRAHRTGPGAGRLLGGRHPSPPPPHTCHADESCFLLTGTQPGPVRPSRAAAARLDSITPASRVVVGMSRRDGILLSGPNLRTDGIPKYLQSYRWSTSLEPRGQVEANNGPVAKPNRYDCRRDCADWRKPV